MKKVTKLTFGILLLLGLSSSLYSNGLSLNSVGTKALGMGGAFVGLSNDATAIYWNPAGLAGQESSILAYFTGVMPLGTYKSNVIDAEMQKNIYPTGGLIANYKMNKLVLALGVYVPSGLGAEWDFSDFNAHHGVDIEYLSKIGVINISPAVAYQVTDKFSVGLALNISYAMFDLKQNVDGALFGLGQYQFEEESTGLAFGATIGLKYKFNEKLEAGATVRLASKVAMTGTASNGLFPALPTIPPGANPYFPQGLQPLPLESDFDRDVTWPLWIGGGLAYKPTSCLTLALDVQYSQWSELDKLVATYDDPYWQGFLSAAGQDEFNLEWEDAVQIRVGGEYMISPATALRLGYYYDPAPSPDETLSVLFPSSTNHVGTIGIGHSFGTFKVDAAAEYLFGADRTETEPWSAHHNPGVHHLDVFAFSIGFGMRL